jgi:hypothetical protein
MHPKIEARRKKVEIAHQINSLKLEKVVILQNLHAIRDALLATGGDYMNTPSIKALASSAENILKTIEEIDVYEDESHIMRCTALFGSSTKFIESVRRTLSAANSVMPE